MGELCALYGVNDENLAVRRAFIGLDDETIRVLASLRDWAEGVADPIAKELTDHHFEFPATGEFFRDYVKDKEFSLAALREGWAAAQAGHFRQIFREASTARPFGADYFEGLLGVGALHNKINLPLKWYIGSYPTYLDIVRRHIDETLAPPAAKDRRSRRGAAADDGDRAARAYRAISTVFNYDLQAITDAFYYDTFATMGVDLKRFRPAATGKDLADGVADVKRTVLETLSVFVAAAEEIGGSAGHVGESLAETTRSVQGISHAIERVASGAERQATMLSESQGKSEEAAEAAARLRALSDAGVQAAEEANAGMQSVRASAGNAREAIGELARKSQEIDSILGTISGIAGQTNLLALNAAIEAARAGEQGRGFAVVAEEVRKLAEESGRSAESIASLVEEIQAQTERAVTLVEDAAGQSDAGTETSQRAREAFVEIGGAVGQIGERLQEVTATTAAVAEESTATAQEVSSLSGETNSATDQAKAAYEELAVTSERLLELSRQFALQAAS